MSFDFHLLVHRAPYLLKGAWVSLQLVVLVMLISAPPAALCALALESSRAWIRLPVMGLSWIFRGIPQLIVLFLVYFALPQFGVVLDSLPAAVAGFVCSNTFLYGELIAAAFRGIHHGQRQAIAALGLPRGRTYWRILLPQALPSIIPPYISYSTDMVKGTALAGSIGVSELLTRSGQIIQTTNRPFEVLIFVLVIYSIINAALIGIQRVAEHLLSLRPSH